MPLRPIDALFIHLERRVYVVYYRGELWQLPRMKIDELSWQRRQPYQGSPDALYLSRHQAIQDPVLAQKLRTLNLPMAVRGITLPRFEAWWESHGFDWLKDQLTIGESPLAAHTTTSTTTNSETRSIAPQDSTSTSANNDNSAEQNSSTQTQESKKVSKQNDSIQATEKTDVFAELLADLVEEVLYK